MAKFKIGFDLDGVGYVFGESVRRSLALDGFHVPPATDEFCQHWDFYEFWGMNKDEFALASDVGVNRGIVFGPGEGLTRPGFFETMARVKEMGHEVIIITHRYQGDPGNAERNTYRWLEPHKHLYDKIVFSGDKTAVETDMFVEDNRDNYDKLVDAGVDAYLINRPWNGPYTDTRARIDDIVEFGDMVAARTNGLIVV